MGGECSSACTMLLPSHWFLRGRLPVKGTDISKGGV